MAEFDIIYCSFYTREQLNWNMVYHYALGLVRHNFRYYCTGCRLVHRVHSNYRIPYISEDLPFWWNHTVESQLFTSPLQLQLQKEKKSPLWLTNLTKQYNRIYNVAHCNSTKKYRLLYKKKNHNDFSTKLDSSQKYPVRSVGKMCHFQKGLWSNSSCKSHPPLPRLIMSSPM